MKATVKKEFQDKKTRIVHTPGHEKTGEWSGTKARFEEINQKLKARFKANALIAIEEAAPVQKETAKPAEPVQKEAKPKTETKERKIKGETK